ncbi:MAG: hypothetical protein RL077_5629 [Verrucomicrobiota bacterium]|jgi:hypothetical protein
MNEFAEGVVASVGRTARAGRFGWSGCERVRGTARRGDSGILLSAPSARVGATKERG